ncbi:hypothetical protein MferCBS31731_006889 [Microsporum ferrugineum]
MALFRHMGSRTQAEDKAHSFPGPIDDSFRNTLGHHGQMQSPSCTADKGTAFSYAVDGDIPFHAGLSLMRSVDLPTRRWTADDNLSSLHSELALNSDTTQHHHTFDHTSRLLTVGGHFDVDSGVLFQDPKGQLIERSSRPTAGNWMEQQQVYKYNTPSATREPRHHKSNEPTPLMRKGDIFSDHTTLSPSSSPSPGTMAYQDNWFQQRLESYDLQQMVQSPDCLESTTASYSQQFHDRRESLSHLSTASRESNRSPLDSTTPISTPRYSSTVMSHQAHSPSVPTTNDSSEAPCQQYQGQSAMPPVSNHTPPPPPPPPQQILRSQPCDVPGNSWQPESIGVSIFQCSQPNIPPHESENWWVDTPPAISNRSLQPPFPHASYSSAVTSMPYRNQHHRFTHIPESVQNSGLMIGMDASSSELNTSIQESAMPTPQLPGPKVALTPGYSPLPYIPSQHQRPHHPPPIQTTHTSIPIAHSAPTISVAPRSAPVFSRRLPPGHISQQSPKSRYHGPPHQRRGQHARKAASFSGQTTKCSKPNSSNNSTHNSISSGYNNVINKAAKNVSFVNFTPEDSHKLLTGVAPSGSSKTKARREQEARDKRRKLSEAALLAVRRAGGDVEALEAVFC